MRLQPENAKYYNNLAWALATCPDSKYRNGKEAVGNAKKACELDGEKTWQFLGTLAAAYAECGDFEKACETEGKAIDLADEKDKAECRSHLELYKQGKPFHEEGKKK
jgi:tetratricopeptide (TPR) repeat protein